MHYGVLWLVLWVLYLFDVKYIVIYIVLKTDRVLRSEYCIVGFQALAIRHCEVSNREGIDFRFFWKIDMKGPYLANIGKNNHVLELKKNKLSNFLLILIFQNPITLVKSKNENHQNSVCDSSKEPYRFTKHKFEEKTKKYWLLTDLIAKNLF